MVAVVEEVEVEPLAPPPRWLLVVTGILWLIVSLVILSLDSTSVLVISFMVAALLLLAGIDEIVAAVTAPGWKWLHGILAAVFLIGGLMALLDPFQTFGILALLVGWFLLINGFFDIAISIGLRTLMPLWGLRLTSGILQILLGFWALGYPGRSAWLLVLWVGIGAMFRGITALVAAFTEGGHR